jgi:hypothetical protein
LNVSGRTNLRLLLLSAVLSLARPSWAEDTATAAPMAPLSPPHAEPAPAPERPAPQPFSPYSSLSDTELVDAYEHTSLGGPIAVTVIGGVISTLALPTFVAFGIGSLACAANSVADCTPVDTVTVISAASTVVFGTMTIVGVVMLNSRSQKRSAIKNEMWRRQAASASLRLGLTPVRGGSMLAIGGTF